MSNAVIPEPRVLHRSLHTRDVEVARTEISRLFCPHRLRPSSRGVDVRLRAHRRGPVAVVGLDYGHLVRITPGTLDTFYLVQLPLAGRARIDQGRGRILSTPEVAAVLSPEDPIDMVWGEQNPQLLCWIERTALERELELLTGEAPHSPLRFHPSMPVAAPGVRPWLRDLRRLWQELGHDCAPRVDHWQRSVLTSLLLTQPHNHAALVRRGAGETSTVRRATAYMEARIDESLSMPHVAAGVGVGVRMLQKAFRSELDTSPAAWLKHRRMELAHQRLLAAEPGTTTVTAIAGQLAITHLGRFAIEYREMFGEHPSDSLARAAVPVDPA